MKSALKNIILFLIFPGLLSCGPTTIRIDRITTELMVQPVGISIANPRFGWSLDADESGTYQSAYQVVVSEAEKEVWNSGKVTSGQSQLITYKGEALIQGKRYGLAVTVWDQDDQVSKPVSTFFEMAPSPDRLNAKWIGAIRREDAHLPQGRHWHAPSLQKNREMYDSVDPLAKCSILLRKEAIIDKTPQKATLYISGLGHYELTLDGQKVGQNQFEPLWTDYDKSVFYNIYDLTEKLTEGKHAFGVMLGNGMYNVLGDRYRKFWISFGPPTLFFQLQLNYSDGSEEMITSDKTWRYSKSPITFNCVFGGEDYDARLEQQGWNEVDFDDSNWNEIIVQEAPEGKLKAQLAPAVKVLQRFAIRDWDQIDSAVYVFDMGQNLSGFPSITVKGKAGQKIRLIPAEKLGENGTATQQNTGGPHYYEYTLKGDEIEEWQPRFSYYGYQYLQVEGVRYGKGKENAELPELLYLESDFIYSNAEETGSFECSNEIFTKTHWLINNAIKSNMQAVFTDCPHREKLGWLEEIYLNGPGLLFNYDLTRYFPKEMMDMQDAQRENGLIPNIAPEYVDFSGEPWGADFTDSPEWGTAAVMVPWLYYQYYGDPSVIEKYYRVMRRYVDYLTSRAEQGVVSHGLGDWYDYGEHPAGYAKNSPISLSATAHYYLCTKMVACAAKDKVEKDYYDSLQNQIKEIFNREFFNPKTNQYGTGSQYSNAVAIYMGLVEPKNKKAVLENLVTDIEVHGNRLTTGDIGNRYLFQTLAENDLNELLFRMLNHYDVPGYGYQLQYGLTTLAEQWDPKKGNSWNHFMLGQIEEWLFKNLLGIQPDPNEPGFEHFYIIPDPVGDMKWANGSFKSLYGEINVSWERNIDSFEIEIDVPVNSTASFKIPKGLEFAGEFVDLVSGHHSLTYRYMEK